MTSTSTGPFEAKNLRQFGLGLVYFISLFFPALFLGGSPGPVGAGDKWMMGHECLGFFPDLGFLPYIVLIPPWWANPCFFVGMVCLVQERRRCAFWCGVVATLLSLGTMLIAMRELSGWIAGRTKSFPYGPGYFLWLSCMVGLTLVAHLEMRQQKREKPR